MNAIAQTGASLRRIPLVFRIGITLLAIALVGGQINQRQPAGAWTKRQLAFVKRMCPLARYIEGRVTVADGARALDRALYHRLVNHYRPGFPRRCQSGKTAAFDD